MTDLEARPCASPTADPLDHRAAAAAFGAGAAIGLARTRAARAGILAGPRRARRRLVAGL